MAATWNELPAAVRAAVTAHLGTVSAASEVTGGKNNDLAAVLTVDGDRRVFVKGIEGVSRRMRMLRREATAGQLAPGIAPSVLFAEDVDEWLVLGFDYVTGRPADLAPGSPDLPRVAEVVNRIGALPADDLRSLRDRWGGVDWWGKLVDEAPDAVAGLDVAELAERAAAAPELADGNRLVHTDLHGEQFVLGDDGAAHVIDWGFPGSGAPWVDPAYLVLRLVESGHTPDEAEAWARRELPAYAAVDEEAVTAFAVYVAGMWTYWAVNDPAPGKVHRARLARDYAAWRLTGAARFASA